MKKNITESEIEKAFDKLYGSYSGEARKNRFLVFKEGVMFFSNYSESSSKYKDSAKLITDYLNEARKVIFPNKNAKGFKFTASIEGLISSRLKEGNTIEDFIQVIDYKCHKWKNTDMAVYLRPSTLFKASKFPEYLCEAEGFKKPEQSALDKDISGLMG